MRIERLNSATSSRLVVIDINAPLHVVAVSLSHPGIGLVVVSDEDGKATGVVSKSDLIRHILVDSPKDTSVAEIMSTEIISCAPEDDIQTAWETMVARRLQNMPVLAEDGKPIGILDIREAMRVLFEQEELHEHMLADYIAGIGYR